RSSQSSGETPKNLPRRNAVSAVIARLPLTISLMRFGGTSRSRASALMLRPSGFMNSSRRISPGGIGSRCLVPMSVSVIVDDFDIRCVGILPPKADAPLIVDADTVLAVPGSAQRLEPVAGRNHQVLEGPRAM